MAEVKKRLLNSEDLKTLYQVTNPKLEEKPKLQMVIRKSGKNWEVENPYSLRGYRACQNHLESLVRKYESADIWPSKCALGIGLFKKDKLIQVLTASDLGYRTVKAPPSSLPLDDLLNSVGLTRNDIQK